VPGQCQGELGCNPGGSVHNKDDHMADVPLLAGLLP
jgi:hypothetical protein